MRRAPQECRAQGARGAALAVVLGFLAVISVLVGLGFQLIRDNERLAALNRWEAQARLLAASGLDYALARIGPPDENQNLVYAADSLVYNLEDPNLSFALHVGSHGLFARAKATGMTRLPGPAGLARDKKALLGQSLDLAALPALALLNREGNMVLAGHAEVLGPVLLWKGDVRKATDSKVRWRGGRGHAGETWDSTSPLWPRIQPDFARAEEWLRSQESMLSARSVRGDGDFDTVRAEMVFQDSGHVFDTSLASAAILAPEFLRISSGAMLRDVKLLARNILVEDGARLERVLAYASRKLEIRGDAALHGGQFAAGDSLVLSMGRPLEGVPVFYVRGSMKNRGLRDSAYVGALVLERVQGEGIFLAAMIDRPVEDHGERLVVLPGTKVAGLLYTGGLARMEGELEGSLICHNLKFAYDGTIWMGHLKDSRIRAFAGKKSLVAPLLFPGWPPMAMAVGL